jgi:hypothetical protein
VNLRIKNAFVRIHYFVVGSMDLSNHPALPAFFFFSGGGGRGKVVNEPMRYYTIFECNEIFCFIYLNHYLLYIFHLTFNSG